MADHFAYAPQSNMPIAQPTLVLSPRARRETILQIMGSARRSLIFSLFRCDDFSVLEAVAAAVRRNVAVKVLITRRARDWRKRLDELSSLLESAGAEVYRYDPMLKYHAKYMVADEDTAFVATLNFTRKCFTSTCDSLLVTHDPNIVLGLKTLFEIDVRTPGIPLPTLTDHLIIGPDQTRSRLTAILGSARESIRIIDHRLTDPQVLSLLNRKAQSGVAVQVLRQGAVGDLVCHGTMFLVDGRIAVIGSAALLTASLDSRREVSIVVSDTRVLREMNEFFDGLLQQSPVGASACIEPLTERNAEDDDDE
jgi:phosphatidylserine/phosphatidylglycerophosphate/cardiolipin synthase-like enzyme